MEARYSTASRRASEGGTLRGSAQRRRHSMDWPLSREEKKRCAIQLYEREVQTSNQVIESKDRALQAAKETIKELRRASTASTTATGARSSLSESPKEKERMIDSSPSLSADLNYIFDSSPSQDRSTGKVASPREPPAMAEPPSAARPTDINTRPQRQDTSERNASPRHRPSMQRSSSLEVFSSGVSSWWGQKPAEADVVTDSTRGKGAQEGGNRVASPRRHGSQQRSGSLTSEAKSLWSGAWKGMRNVARDVARTATVTASETARILAEEAQQLTHDVRSLVGDGRSHETSEGVPSSNHTKNVAVAEYFEWAVDFEPDTDTGLELAAHSKGEPWRVFGVTKGLAIDTWNADAVPVTVYLYPGRREKVMRRVIVKKGDELVAVDGEPLNPALDLEEPLIQVEGSSAQCVRKCQAMTFRRKVPPPVQKVSSEDGKVLF